MALSVSSPSLSLAAPTGSAAEEGGQTEVVLKDGSKVRGTIYEIVPNEHVILRLPNGKGRRYEWKDVEKIVAVPKEAATAATTAPSQTAPAEPAPTTPTDDTADNTAARTPPQPEARPAPSSGKWGSGARVVVHLDPPSGTTASLARHMPNMPGFSQVCDAPCDLNLPTNEWYALTWGDQIQEIRLNGSDGDYVTIREGSSASSGGAVSVILFVCSGVAVVVGGVLIGLGTTEKGEAATLDYASGGGAIAIAIAALVGGIAVRGPSSTGPQQVLTGSQQATREDRFLRTPTWSSSNEPVIPRATSWPILSHSF
jgi:hypothetical protein